MSNPPHLKPPEASLPRLETRRLVLRALRPDDAPALVRLASRREIADTTISMPPPYTLREAQAFVASDGSEPAGQRSLRFGLELKSDSQLIGAIGLRDLDREHAQAEMGFWVGVDHWRQGYATEAAAALLRYGFETLGLNRICAHHMVRNPASGRVLEKLGAQREGLLRQRVRKWGIFEDVVVLAILRQDWLQASRECAGERRAEAQGCPGAATGDRGAPGLGGAGPELIAPRS